METNDIEENKDENGGQTAMNEDDLGFVEPDGKGDSGDEDDTNFVKDAEADDGQDDDTDDDLDTVDTFVSE